MRELARQNVRDQFRATLDAARSCDLILVAGALQTAGRSVAEALKIPYVFAAYCPTALRAHDHPPPRMRSRIRSQSLPRLANRWLWMLDERSWNRFFRETVNEQRAALGLPDIASVPRHMTTDLPWLAADPALGPAAATAGMQVTQTGAWLLSNRTALPDPVEKFLAAGEPPVYLGFGSMFSPAQTGQILLDAVRKLGRRAIVSQGWANLAPTDAGSDCICVGDLPHEMLFPRVAAVVHHGGAGTTVTSALSGIPQVVVPHHYDQFYWARRVHQLGIGVSGPRVARLTVDSLVAALRTCLGPEVTARARSFAFRVEPNGAHIAAERLVAAFA
jgi:vancomycin aglycone glucosyltransferase